MDPVPAHVGAAHAPALAILVRVLGDLDRAEDALQEAARRALETWPERGIPDAPVAWLVRTARNVFVDGARRRATEEKYRPALTVVPPPPADERIEEQALTAHVHDDLLRLVFTCCHPAIPREEQVALTLKTVAGLSVGEIARAFLVSERAMEQRITRAKRRIRQREIPYEVPRSERLPERLTAVLGVVYLIFNEGYKATAGAALVRRDLCELALRLARLLERLFRGEAEVLGLLALLRLHHARCDARLDPSGEVVTIEEQDRGLWDREGLLEGRALLANALRQRRPGPYQIQAAIADVHCRAERFEETDWDEIASLYAVLERLDPSPVVRLNRAVAVARRDGPEAGLALLADLDTRPDMQRYVHYHAARAGLLAEAGRADEAACAYARALEHVTTAPERAWLERRRAELSADLSGSGRLARR